MPIGNATWGDFTCNTIPELLATSSAVVGTTCFYTGNDLLSEGAQGVLLVLTALPPSLAGNWASLTASSAYNEKAAVDILGDSITGQHTATGLGGLAVAGVQGMWNWANWLLGSPFIFNSNLGVSGAMSKDIYSRVPSVRAKGVLILAGTNDVLQLSSVATVPQITAAVQAQINSVDGVMYTGLKQLRAQGISVVLGTIPPNNAYSSPTDARISFLDQLNAWIVTTPELGLASHVVDIFQACWDSTLPTQRVFKTNYSYDGTHFTNLAGFAAGQSGRVALANLYELGSLGTVSPPMKAAVLPIQQLTPMSLITGVQSRIDVPGTGATGQVAGSNQTATDVASGWRVRDAVGTASFVCSVVPRPDTQQFIGPYSGPTAPNENFQKIVISGAIAGDSLQVSMLSALVNNSPQGVSAGDIVRFSVELMVENPTGLSQVWQRFTGSFVAGTSPADQPYSGSATAVRSTVGLSTTTADTERPYPAGFRIVVESLPVRIPENINPVTTPLTATFEMNFTFFSSGGATVYVGRPQIYRETFS